MNLRWNFLIILFVLLYFSSFRVFSNIATKFLTLTFLDITKINHLSIYQNRCQTYSETSYFNRIRDYSCFCISKAIYLTIYHFLWNMMPFAIVTIKRKIYFRFIRISLINSKKGKDLYYQIWDKPTRKNAYFISICSCLCISN